MKKVEIGYITKPQGLKGEVRAKIYTDNNEIFNDVKQIYINGQVYNIEKYYYRVGFVVLKLKEVSSINEAEKMRNFKIEIDVENLYFDEDEVLVDDIIGYEVITNNNEIIGKLTDISTYSTNEVYTVKKQDGSEILFPNARNVIEKIDQQNKTIIVNQEILQEMAVNN